MIEIFEGSPKHKFYDILFNANKNLVADELDRVLEQLCAINLFLEKKGIDQIEILEFIDKNQDEILEAINDRYIEISGEILSKNE